MKIDIFGHNFHPKASDITQNGFDNIGRKFTKLSNSDVQISINIFLVLVNAVWI